MSRAEVAPCGHEWSRCAACDGDGCEKCDDVGHFQWCWAGCGLAEPVERADPEGPALSGSTISGEQPGASVGEHGPDTDG